MITSHDHTLLLMESNYTVLQQCKEPILTRLVLVNLLYSSSIMMKVSLVL